MHAQLATFSDDDVSALDADDRRALELMRDGIVTADSYRLPVAPALTDGDCEEAVDWRRAIDEGGAVLRVRLEACYGARAEALATSDGVLTRLQILARLGSEPDAANRRALFLALEPLWRVVNGDDDDGSPYRAFMREEARAWRAGASPAAANAAALGVTTDEIETWALTALGRLAGGGRGAVTRRGARLPWSRGTGGGARERPSARSGRSGSTGWSASTSDLYASLGADLDALGVRFDIRPRPGRPPSRSRSRRSAAAHGGSPTAPGRRPAASSWPRSGRRVSASCRS